MKSVARIWGLMAGILLFGGASLSWAGGWNDSSWQMSLKVFCQVFSILTGELGLLIGFVLALNGLYMIVTKNAAKAGWISLILGALLTALPGIITTTFLGAGHVLNTAGVSQFSDTPLAYAIQVAQGGMDACNSLSVDLSPYDTTAPGFNSSGAASLPGYATGRGDMGSAGIAGVSRGDSMGGTAPEFIAAGDCPSNQACLSAIGSNRGKPMVPNDGRVNSCVGPRNVSMKPGYQKASRNHKGVDINCGTTAVPLMALRGGELAATGCIKACGRGYGCCSVIKVGADYDYYMHQDLDPANVGIGKSSSIGAGSPVGFCGRTGEYLGSLPRHLHYEIRSNGLAPCNRRDPITVM